MPRNFENRTLKLQICGALLFRTALTGCDSGTFEKKEPLPLEKVTPEIMKAAQDKFPDLKSLAAYTKIEDGQPVYELKGQSKTGKMLEV
ncbi:MAG: hypothetical protein ACK5YX_12070 [Planctomyces sp.]